MSEAVNHAFDFASQYPVTITVLIIVLIGFISGWAIWRHIREEKDDEVEASARRVNALWAAFRREEERRKREALAYLGKEQP